MRGLGSSYKLFPFFFLLHLLCDSAVCVIHNRDDLLLPAFRSSKTNKSKRRVIF